MKSNKVGISDSSSGSDIQWLPNPHTLRVERYVESTVGRLADGHAYGDYVMKARKWTLGWKFLNGPQFADIESIVQPSGSMFYYLVIHPVQGITGTQVTAENAEIVLVYAGALTGDLQRGGLNPYNYIYKDVSISFIEK